MTILMTLTIIAMICVLILNQAAAVIWLISYSIVALLLNRHLSLGVISQVFILIGFILPTVAALKPLRRQVSKIMLYRLKSAMPAMSATEREALVAGTIGWEAELFSGAPNFTRLLSAPFGQLSLEETEFLQGPVTELCRMIDDWDITHNRFDMPPEMWDFIKKNRFFGMIIPKEYGGLGFSATAVMSVLTKLYARSVTVASTIAVPNSLGPAELLLHYGTDFQKKYYLPRLASGEEIPCFALTGPNAGSDAASIPDTGVVCRRNIEGKAVLGILLNWDKRYITLSPVATLIGLAFRLFDPNELLGKGVDIGISCALIPVSTPGVTTGRRHFPLNTAFMNGPTQGKDVFIPIEYLIGGESQAGCGWRMLMECLSAGRAISLPSSASGGSQAAALASGAYARVRKQFKQSIGYFEGVGEALARIAGNTYLIDAALTMTAAAIDMGEKSAVAGAILKYHTTERARQVASDAMDIHGGKGICLGPKNYLGRAYQSAPISITVEGANILTRSLIIFGQGAIRCHPYVLDEMESIAHTEIARFDNALWGHAAFFLSNTVKSLFFSFTDGYFMKTPSPVAKRYYQLIFRYSSQFAFMADFCMMTLGASLKRKESISARLGDILSNLYLISGVLKRFHHEGELAQDLCLVDWCCQHLFYQIETAMKGVTQNFPTRWGRFVLTMMTQPFGRKRQAPSDQLGKTVAGLLLEPNETRQRLTRLVFSESLENCPLGQLEAVFEQITHYHPLIQTVARAAKEGKLQGLTMIEQLAEAKQQGIITADDYQQLILLEKMRQSVIAVDDFSTADLAITSD